ncbi:NAD(P)/FAD-dependent oxidoreductase [uncultured Kordia sp.]|uniref:flavin monoamine oxidase family protein n=1 Tax=uncultured Kordia sp. TaxID=507699 RepID=UPI002614B7B6|nr:NAD(P)/FAD-dependent oxidoreductase [uncultured Kordia sp.]
MTRKDFIKACGLLGISLPFQSILASCSSDDTETITANFTGKVLIIGAGPAGMASAYLLAQQGIDFEILEAAPTYGGRIKHNTTFADFPISLGGEWLHVASSELPAIVNDDSVNITTVTQGYQGSDVIGYFENGNYSTDTLASWGTYIDQKFIGSSWLDFFETYIVPSIQSKFVFNTEVTSINYQDANVTVMTNGGESYEADKVIVAVPLKILQNNRINFTPALSNAKQQAIQNAPIWGGIKVFLEFTEEFYPVFLSFADSETAAGQRIYYDAAYGQNSTKNILGLFAVGQQAEQYQNLSGDAQRDYILNELDAVFNGAATQNYVNHIVQNWNDDPFIGAAYLADNAPSSISTTLASSISNKVYFAGDAYTQEDDWSAVHNAVRSARDAVSEVLVD